MRYSLAILATFSTVVLSGLTFKAVAQDAGPGSERSVIFTSFSDEYESKLVRCPRAKEVYRLKNKGRWTDEEGIEWTFGFKKFGKEKDFRFYRVTLSPGNNVMCAYGSRDGKGKMLDVTVKPVMARLPSNGKMIERSLNNWVNRGGVKSCGTDMSQGSEDSCYLWLVSPTQGTSAAVLDTIQGSSSPSFKDASVPTQNNMPGLNEQTGEITTGASTGTNNTSSTSNTSTNSMNQNGPLITCPSARLATNLFRNPGYRSDNMLSDEHVGDTRVTTQDGFDFSYSGNPNDVGRGISDLSFSGVLLYPNQIVTCHYSFTQNGITKEVMLKLDTMKNNASNTNVMSAFRNINKIDTRINNQWNWAANGAGIFRCSPQTNGSEETCTMSYEKN